ncbi:hypothetical protein M9Y10_034675 [Tritrichomonas musculus]|uniref:Protein kinase domain-containing protein n=1 Tax=Tritrichomonas musculus TaxID=1915356 RepID=A0ABR2KFM8_9EUKA
MRGRVRESEEIRDKNKEELVEKIIKKKDKIRRLKKTNENNEQTINKQKTTIDNQNTTIDNQKATIDDQKATIDNQNATIDNQKKKINDQKKTINDQKEELKRIKNYLLLLKEKAEPSEKFELAQFEIGKTISSGASSIVKRIIRKERKQYAMKEISNERKMREYVAETQILSELRHPCIIRIFDYNNGNETQAPYIIEAFEKMSLDDAIKKKEVSRDEINLISVEIVLGMRFIHKKGFLHRDLKPLNILLSKKKHVRICDFGLSKPDDPDQSISQTSGVGTMHFMAPEIFEGKRSSKETDVYSFGAVLYFIIKGEYLNNWSQAREGNAIDLPETVEWVVDLINKCLSIDSKKRPSFDDIFEIMKSNNFNLFVQKGKKLNSMQKNLKEMIEKRVLKIEAFEYQHEL